MKIPDLGTLKEVKVREAWPHEAHSFTPWLAEHLDTLAEVIGIPLELKGREVAVDTFSADILARNPMDDSLVLIENQLEATDHTHLGQIMTYLAGLEAHVVIWIAADFCDAHLSAVRWLNDHTVPPFAFFAVKVKVVRIGNSPLAPIFDVVVKPNQWERTLQAVARDSGALSNLGQFRQAFWSHYLSRYPEEREYGEAGGYSNRWRPIPALEVVISSYIAQRSVGVFIRGPRGSAAQNAYDTLLPYQDQLTELTGATMGNPEDNGFFVQYYRAETSDKSNWDTLTTWLYETTQKYERALQTIAGE